MTDWTAAKRRAASLSLGYNIGATALKIVAAALTGSVSLLSEASHSATDIVASLLAYFAIRAAAAPPDDEHTYGHSKMETMAGFGESILLLVVVGYIAFEAIKRFLEPAIIDNAPFGIGVMIASAVSSLLVGLHVRGVGRLSRSTALEANGQHLLIDCYTSVGVLVALVITFLTGWTQADALIGLLFAIWLGFGAWQMFRRAFGELVDARLPDDTHARVETVLRDDPRIYGFHQLRTRKASTVSFVEAHIEVPADWTVRQAHDVADDLEKKIAATIPPAVVIIHVDPHDPDAAEPPD